MGYVIPAVAKPDSGLDQCLWPYIEISPALATARTKWQDTRLTACLYRLGDYSFRLFHWSILILFLHIWHWSWNQKKCTEDHHLKKNTKPLVKSISPISMCVFPGLSVRKLNKYNTSGKEGIFTCDEHDNYSATRTTTPSWPLQKLGNPSESLPVSLVLPEGAREELNRSPSRIKPGIIRVLAAQTIVDAEGAQ